jgi:hypothetical protein
LINSSSIINRKGNITDSITVLSNMRINLSLFSTKRACESELDVVALDNMSAIITMPGLKTLIGTRREAKTHTVVRSGLFSVAYPESTVIKPVESSNLRAFRAFTVACHFNIINLSHNIPSPAVASQYTQNHH